MHDPCQNVISTLEDHNSRLDKEAIILAQAEAGNKEFLKMKMVLVWIGIVLASLSLALLIAHSQATLLVTPLLK